MLNKSTRISFIACMLLMAICVMACGSNSKTSNSISEHSSVQITEPVSVPDYTETQPSDLEQQRIELGREATITFIGDMATDHFFKDNFDKDGIKGVLSPEMLELFSCADIFVANHEYCTTDIPDSNRLDYQTWIEHVPTENDEMLKSMSVDLVNLANNHAFDYGLQGFIDTLDTLDKLDIKYVGGGLDVERATDPVVFKVGGKTVAFFAASSLLTDRALNEWTAREDQPGISVLFTWYDTFPYMEAKIKEAKEKYDYVIAITHWGSEGNNMFSADEQSFAHTLIDLGVDVIIGGHAHVVQGVEYYNDGVVFYGLGNFLFAPEPVDTMAVTITIEKNGELSFKVTPCKSAYYYVKPAYDGTVFNIINNNSVNAKVLEDGTVVRTD